MPPGFFTFVNWVSLLGSVGVIVWWLARRSQWKNETVNVPFKAALSLVAFTLLIAFAHGMGFSFGGAFAVPFAALAFGVVMSFAWAPHIGEWMAKPITSLFDGGSAACEPRPLYSIAEAKRKKGLYHEAVFALHEQLRKFPKDVTGQVMLAEIQAENLNDLPGAHVTIERLCAQSGHAPENLAIALNRLADWNLKFGQDVGAARQALEKILELLPDSEQAQMAIQRIAHLGTTENLLASRERETIRLRPGAANIGLRQESASLQKTAEDPFAKAAEYVKHLEKHPLDSESREKLAMIYAEDYHRVDLATSQLEQLIQQPNQPISHQIRWLNLLASLHIKYGKDYELARAALQRIIDAAPDSAIAAMAQQRLSHLKLDLKGTTEAQVIKLGQYEQNIGLKGRTPKRGGE